MSEKNRGFTLLEVMVAIGIFAMLMFAITQMMRVEMGLFQTENIHNQNEQKARSALNHVLDQVRLYGYVAYLNDGVNDEGLYSLDPEGRKSLVNLDPSTSSRQDEAEMYYLPARDELWYNEPASSRAYLIADQITTLEIQGVSAHLARIRVVAGDPGSDISFELVTWARLY